MKILIQELTHIRTLLIFTFLFSFSFVFPQSVPSPPGNPIDVFEQDFTQIPVPVFADYAERFNGGRVGDLWANIQYHKSQLLPDPLGHLFSVDVAGATSDGSGHSYNFRSEYRELDITSAPAQGTTQRYAMSFSVVDLPDLHAPLTIFQRFNREKNGPDLNVELTGVHQFSNAVSGDIQVIAWDGRIRTGKLLAAQNELVVEVYNHNLLGAYRVTLNGQLVHEAENINTMPSTQGTWWQFGLYWHGIQDGTLRNHQYASGNTEVSFVYHWAQKATYDHMAIGDLPDHPLEPIPCNPPADWNYRDIGTTGFGGVACQEGEMYYTRGSGTDIWNTADAFFFVSKTLSGDGAIYAKVTHLDPTDPWAKAGVMMREKDAPGSKNIFMALTAERGVTFQQRPIENDLTTSTRGAATVVAPIWLKLVRVRNTFSGYHSPDGLNWKLLDSTNVDMPFDLDIGLAVTSHNNSLESSALFEPVIVEKYKEVNNPPVFSLSAGMQVEEDFPDSLLVVAEPYPVATTEASEKVVYTLEPSAVDFADIELDTTKGEIIFRCKPQANGQQVFTLTADDGQRENNSYSRTFNLNVRPVNDPPVFQLDKDSLKVRWDIVEPAKIGVLPLEVPTDEAQQTVIYSLQPETLDFADLSIDPSTGEVQIEPYPESTGSELIWVIADDGENEYNTHKQPLYVTVTEPSPLLPFYPNDPPAEPIRINVGGESYQTSTGLLFQADQTDLVRGETKSYEVSRTIRDTRDPSLYQTERFGKDFEYELKLPDGEYEVKLHFAEIYWNKKGRRIFDVDLEGVPIEIKDLDLYAQTGRYRAFIQTFKRVEVEDGALNIHFHARKDNAKLSAIEVVPVARKIEDAVSWRINSGGKQAAEFGGYTFVADTFYSSGSMEWENTSLPSIASTEYDELYHTERISQEEKGSFSYDIPVANGEYAVFLHFAEIWFGAGTGVAGKVGRRVFDVFLERQPGLIKYDLIKEAGPLQALVERFDVTVEDGELNIDFNASTDKPKIAAIEVLRPEDAHTSISDSSRTNRNSFVNLNDPGSPNSPINWIKLAPNPTVGNTRLLLENAWEGIFSVHIYDGFGKLYRVFNFEKLQEAAKFMLPVDDLIPGLYTLSIRSETFQHALKLWRLP